MKRLLLQLAAAAVVLSAPAYVSAQDAEEPVQKTPESFMRAIWNEKWIEGPRDPSEEEPDGFPGVPGPDLPTASDPANFEEGQGYLNLFDAYNYTRRQVLNDPSNPDSGYTWSDFEMDTAARELPPDFETARIKLQNVSVQIGGEGFEVPSEYLDENGVFNIYKFDSIYMSTIRLSGVKINFGDNIWSDGGSRLIVDNGTTLTMKESLHGGIDCTFLGTEDNRVTFNGRFNSVDNGKTMNLSYTDYNERWAFNVNSDGTLNASATNWISEGNEMRVFGEYEQDDGTIRNAGVLNITNGSYLWKKAGHLIVTGEMNVTDSEIKLGQVVVSDAVDGEGHPIGGQIGQGNETRIEVGGMFDHNGNHVSDKSKLVVTNTSITIGESKDWVDANGETQTTSTWFNDIRVKGGGTFIMNGKVDAEGKALNHLKLQNGNIEVGGNMSLSNLNVEVGGELRMRPVSLQDETQFFEDAKLTIGDNVNATFSGGISMFERDYNTTMLTANATIEFAGENSHFKFGGDIATPNTGRDVDAGNTVIIMNGKNNSIYTSSNTNIDGFIGINENPSDAGIYSGEAGIIVAGEGNVFSSDNRIHIGRNDGTGYRQNGKAYFHISSTNADNVSKILIGHNYLRNEDNTPQTDTEGNYVYGTNEDGSMQFNNGAGINLGFSDADPDWDDSYVTELVFGGNTLVRDMEGVGRINNITIGTGAQCSDEEKPERQLYGDARMIVEGQNNDLWIQSLNIANVGDLYGGTATVDITGSNNILRMESEINIVSSNRMHGGEGYLNISGDNNVIEVKNGVFVGSGMNDNNDGVWTRTTGGKGYINLTGSGNTFSMGGLNINGRGDVAGGEGHVVFEGRNNVISVSGTTTVGNHDGAVLNEEDPDATPPIGTLVLGGKGNTYNFNGELKFGGGGDNYVGYGKVIIKGGGNTINVNESFQTWAPGDASLGDMRGGILAFQFDSDGISALNITGAETTFNWSGSFLEIDFTGLVGAQDSSWTIITSASNTNFAAWSVDQDFLDNKVNWIARDESDQYSLVKEDLGDGAWALKVYYTSTVPEPAAFAAVFGLAALIFAARRRRVSSRN